MWPQWNTLIGCCVYALLSRLFADEGGTDGEVRLSGGSSLKEGRVEIFHRGEWGTVCEDKWTKENARVVCHELGFTSLVSMYQSFGPGNGRIWMDRVQCIGNESGLASCSHRGWGLSSCQHEEDIGIICSGKVPQLVFSVFFVTVFPWVPLCFLIFVLNVCLTFTNI